MPAARPLHSSSAVRKGSSRGTGLSGGGERAARAAALRPVRWSRRWRAQPSHALTTGHVVVPGDLRSWGGLALGTVLVTLVVCAVHWSALSARAISFDDATYVSDNYLVSNPSWATVRRLFAEVLEPSTVQGYYHPLSILSLMLDVYRGGSLDRPEVFRQTSLLLHVINTILVIVFIYLCIGRPWVSVGAGLIFGVHPLSVEPVVWIAARKALLAATWSLAALVLYVGYVRRGRRSLYAASMITYALALLAKPTSAPLPVLMLILDYWPLGRLNVKRLVEKLPFFAIGLSLGVIAAVSHARTATLSLPQGDAVLSSLLLARQKLAFFLFRPVWPIGLSCYHEVPVAWSWPVALGSALVGVAFLVFSLRRVPALASGILFLIVGTAPILGLFTYGAEWVFAFDNYLYLPMVGLLMAAASALAWLWNGSSASDSHQSVAYRLRRCAVAAAVLAVCVGEASVTHHYLSAWRDSAAQPSGSDSERPGKD